MWRGFAMKKRSPEEAMARGRTCQRKWPPTPSGGSSLEKDGIDVVDFGRSEFNAQVKKDIEDSTHYLKQYGPIK